MGAIKRFSLFIVPLLIFGLVGAAAAQGSTPLPPDPASYQWVKITDGLDNPVYLTNAGDGSGRLFVLEQTGTVFIVKDGVLSQQPFLDISDLVIDDVSKGAYSERGLLGLAFHPDYAKNGLFFVCYSSKNGDTILARYRVMANDPDQADPKSAVTLLTVKQPFDNHKGGQLAFGPDGYLYIGVGDGGSNGDPLGNGQKTDTLLGKILRLDINADTYTVPPSNPFVGRASYAPEIWALGLRNPWRFAFDHATGDLYIGDVGELLWEEIDFQPANDKGGENYGWNLFEGDKRYSQATVNVDVVMPIAVYGHDQGCAVMGGYVYRGKAMPQLNGMYIFGDYCNGRTWITSRDAAGQWQTRVFIDVPHILSSFGVDEQGELYLVDYKGSIWQLQAK